MNKLSDSLHQTETALLNPRHCITPRTVSGLTTGIERFNRMAPPLIIHPVSEVSNLNRHTSQFSPTSSELQVQFNENPSTAERIEVWQTGVTNLGGEVPTAKTIRDWELAQTAKTRPHPPPILQGRRGVDSQVTSGCETGWTVGDRGQGVNEWAEWSP